jgi:hypothetical protein
MYLRELENTKEKSRQCFTDVTLMKYERLGCFVNHVCQLHTCQIVKSRNPHCYFPILPSSLFLFANFTFAKLWSLHCPEFIFSICQLSLLPNCKVKIAQFSSLHSQVVDCTLLFRYFVKLSSPLHLLDCPNELQVAQVCYPSSTWAMAKWACKLPKSDFFTQLGQGGQWTSITIASWCDVQTVFCFLLNKLTQDPYCVEAWHLFLLLS